MTGRKLENLVADLAVENKKTALRVKEIDSILTKIFAENDQIFKEMREDRKKVYRKFYAMHGEIGGISNSNGDFAEEFFYNSLKKTMTFAGIHFDMISDKFGGIKIMPDKTEKKAQFDIVLHNGDSLALIEVKYKANLKDVRKMIEEKLPNFRLLYPQYEKYKLYLGIGSLVLKDRVIQEAKKLGIGLMHQRGDAVEQTGRIKAY